MMRMKLTEPMHDAVMKPLWYCGASTCCHTMSGSHAAMTPTMVFIVASTMARSSVSSVQISLAHLQKEIESGDCEYPEGRVLIWVCDFEKGEDLGLALRSGEGESSRKHDARQAHMRTGQVVAGPFPILRNVPYRQGAEGDDVQDGAEEQDRVATSFEGRVRDPSIHNRRECLHGKHARRIQIDLLHRVLRVLMVLEVLREDGRTARSTDEAALGVSIYA